MNNKHVGITATRKGCNQDQKDALEITLLYLRGKGYSWFHHGDCVGGDQDGHDLAIKGGYDIWVHPPDNPSLRAFCCFDKSSPSKPYLVRNQDIIDKSDILIACPAEKKEQLRSGTWSTVRKARKKGIPIIVIFPDGDFKLENYDEETI